MFMCGLCLCVLEGEPPTSVSRHALRAFVVAHVQDPPPCLLQSLAPQTDTAATEGRPLCPMCASLLRRRAKNEGPRRAPTIMQTVVAFIMSGGATKRPTRVQFLRVLDSLHPAHPMLQHGGPRGLAGLVPLLAEMLESRGDAGFEVAVAHARWALDGRPRMLACRRLAKTLRTHPPIVDDTGPAACRRCLEGRRLAAGETCAAVEVLGAGVDLPAGVAHLEAAHQAVPGVTLFCHRCRSVSLISYEYAAHVRGSGAAFPSCRAEYYRQLCCDYSSAPAQSKN